MKAIVYNEFGDIENGRYESIQDPELKPGTALINVLYAGIIPFDVKVLEKTIPMPHIKFPFIPGAEFSGVIVEISNTKDEFQVGDYVCANPKSYGGAFAEQIVVKTDELSKIPVGLAFESAAACPVSSLAAWHALFEKGKLMEGQKVLIVGASGNVGSYAVQFANKAGAITYAVGSQEYQFAVLDMGANFYLDYKVENYLDGLPEMDLVVDLIGTENQNNLIPLIKEGGTIVSLVQEPDPELLNLQNVNGFLLNSGPNPRQLNEILDQIQKGEIKINISKVLLMQDAVVGLAEVKSGKQNGKVLLKN